MSDSQVEFLNNDNLKTGSLFIREYSTKPFVLYYSATDAVEFDWSAIESVAADEKYADRGLARILLEARKAGALSTATPA